MQRSHIVDEDQMYARFNEQGETKLVHAKDIQPGFSYRRVHYTHEGAWVQKRSSNEIFSDPEYQVDRSELSKLDAQNPRVVLKRLYDLYRHSPKNLKPQFFPLNDSKVNRVQNHIDLPPFVTELGILPIVHYKSLFLTQDFTTHGLYQIIINQNGRFETDVVDDWVPVYEQSLQPIWGMDIEQAWQIILLKFWAKKNGSYYKVKQLPPFQFIQFFTNSNWKYYNLQKEGQYFLEYYTGKIPHGKFVLKTKNTNQVHKSGLIPNSAGYELLDLQQVSGKQTFKDKKFVILVRSTLINKWSGAFSVLDKQVNNKYDAKKYKMALQRDFMIDQNDFLNLFSAAYIASRRQKLNYFSDYYLLNVPPNWKNSIYLKFIVKEEGWFDFCIKQFDDNRVEASTKSRVSVQNDNNSFGRVDDGKRFLKVKFILVKDNTTGRGSVQVEPDYIVADKRYGEMQHFIWRTPPKLCSRQTLGYEVFLKIIINFDINFINFPSTFINFHTKIKKVGAKFIKVKAKFMKFLDVTKKYEQIVFANLFEEVGYGFVGVRMKKSCPYRILIEIDPKLVKESGYKLKNQFKNMNQPFSIVVSNGQCTAVVLNKVSPTAKWPPAGIEIFKER